MRKKITIFYLTALFLTFVSPIFSNPEVKKGKLDLSGIDFDSKNSTIQLDGQWEFYWKKFYYKKDFHKEKPPKIDTYITVPMTWDKASINGNKLSKKGYATYRLKLKLNNTNPISFYSRGFGTSTRIFIDERKVVQVGKPSQIESDAYPRTVPFSFTHFPQQKEIEMIIHISNYHYRMGGPWFPIEVGSPNAILQKIQYSLFLQIFIFGSVFIMGLYHIGIYVNRREALEALFFGIFCLLFSFRTLVLGEKILPTLIPTMPWEVMMKIEYLSFYLGTPVFAYYFYYLFQEIAHKIIINLLGIIGIGFSILVLFTESYIYTHSVNYFQVVSLLCIIYLLIILIIGFVKKTKGIKLFFLSSVIFFSGVIHDILYSNQIVIVPTQISPFTFIAFIFLQSYLLSRKFSEAFTTNEKLAVELRDKNEALTRLDKLKDDFLANTSHELKTPLNGIIGLSESLLDGAIGKLPKNVYYNLSLIITSAKRLSNLVNDILDFSKMRSKEVKVEKKPIDIHSIVNLVLTLSDPLLQQKKIELKNSIPSDFSSALGDENRIQQILYNLVGNAIKFTEEGRVEINAEIKHGLMYISISDTGIGIPEDKFDSIFKSFEQVDSASDRAYGGTGLGLTITRQLVELHGGQIFITSAIGKGSTFTFTLPVSAEKAKKIEVEHQETIQKLDENSIELKEGEPPLNSDDYKYKILIVDDEPINLQVLTNHLSVNKYSVMQASNGREALDLIEKSPVIPDLILLDVMMPKMTGYEVCKKLREKYNANILPIVLLTAKNQVGDLVQGFIHGANDYLTKPFSKDELLTRIKNHLNLSKTSGAYEKFVPQEFIKLINKENIIDVKLGDHAEKYMSVLFCDIRSFTNLSESMSPKDNFNFINSYLKRMTPIIQEHKGFIDKYIGDAIMALFPENTEDAINAAISMQKNLKEYNKHREHSGYQPIEIGIGINTGNLMLGTIGGTNRMEGTVISDAVNIASRIEGMTKKYKTNILISEESYKSITNPSIYHLRSIDRVIAKGKTSAVWIYEVFDYDETNIIEQKEQTKETFQKAILAYKDNRYNSAYELFSQIQKEAPDDKTTQFFLKSLQTHFVKE